jgi:pilus assembly protein CpaB
VADRRYTLLFYTAVLTAVAATYGVYRTLEKAKAQSHVAVRPVAVAARDLPEGASIDRLAVSLVEWPAPTVPAGAYASLDSLVGRVTRVAVFKGEAYVPGRLAPTGTSPGLEVKIEPGKRAMAVKINDVAGISGFIQPNSRVDVLVTLKEDNSTSKQVAKVFMTNMRVLSVGREVQRGDDSKPSDATSATLEVTPDEAERLAVAMNQGTIQLVLRGYGDPDSVRTPGARYSDVLAQLNSAPVAHTEAPPPPPVRHVARAPRPVPPAPPKETIAEKPKVEKPDSAVVQVFRAGKVTQQKFEKTAADTMKDTTKP